MFKTAKRGSLKISVFIIGSLFFATACKKDPKIDPDPVGPVSGTRSQLTKDSIFLYAKDTYYWNSVLPTATVFNARSFDNFESELTAIKTYKGYSPSDPTKLFDKYSFLDDGEVSGELGGVSGDYGFSVFYNDANAGDLRVKYVYENSPASAEKIKRGYQITKINNRSNLVATEATLDFLTDAVFGNSPSVSLTLKKPDGTSMDVTVTRRSYNINPVLFTKVYTIGAKKVGYIVFNSFTTNSSTRLDDVFSEFATAGISEVIVDLRYNGGGSVSTAENFTNLIAPSSVNGKVMYTTFWTQKMQDGNANILANQPVYEDGNLVPYTRGVNGEFLTYADYDYRPNEEAGNVTKFNKRGSVNTIKQAYFIVTGSTASASELVINNLKPIMNVKLIGRKTYGKPVGFFPITIDKLDLYIPQFETKNSLNIGGYFDGMAVDKEASDDVTKEFGDPTERLLANALSYVEKGSFLAVKTGADRIASVGSINQKEVEAINQKLDGDEFKGMVETRLPKLRPKQ